MAYYLRYTKPMFYRTAFKGPQDSLTLKGKPGIDDTAQEHYIIRKTADGFYAWDGFMMIKDEDFLIVLGSSRKLFTTQYDAAIDADQYQGRHHHLGVIHDGPKPVKSWGQEAAELWQAWEAQLNAVTH